MKTERSINDKKDRFVSVVDIGLVARTHATHSYRFNIAQKGEKMQNTRPIDQYQTLDYVMDRNTQQQQSVTRRQE